jgi:hypothetical protein
MRKALDRSLRLPALTPGPSIGTDAVGPSIVPIEPEEGSASKDASASRWFLDDQGDTAHGSAAEAAFVLAEAPHR